MSRGMKARRVKGYGKAKRARGLQDWGGGEGGPQGMVRKVRSDSGYLLFLFIRSCKYFFPFFCVFFLDKSYLSFFLIDIV